MFSQLNGHMRHNVVAYVALFFALSGTAIAAKPLVTGADVQDGSLTGADVQNDSLTGDDVLESGLGKVGDADTLDGTNSTDFLAQGGVPGKFVRRTQTEAVPPHQARWIRVQCDGGEKVVGGGAGFGSADDAFADFSFGDRLVSSRPGGGGDLGPEYWFGAASNQTDFHRTLAVSVICATP